ncbi:uncharacterized protein METZ01_LOCUS412634, partial [marine metagenome]
MNGLTFQTVFPADFIIGNKPTAQRRFAFKNIAHFIRLYIKRFG